MSMSKEQKELLMSILAMECMQAFEKINGEDTNEYYERVNDLFSFFHNKELVLSEEGELDKNASI